MTCSVPTTMHNPTTAIPEQVVGRTAEMMPYNNVLQGITVDFERRGAEPAGEVAVFNG